MSAGDWKELFKAAATGDLSLVQYHIGNGVNPNYQHPEIHSLPLVAAICEGHIAVAKYLLANGADPHLTSEFDNLTAYEAAKRLKQKELMALMPPRDAKANWMQKIRNFFKIR